MKKTIKLLGLLVIAACFFTACANSSGSSDDKEKEKTPATQTETETSDSPESPETSTTPTMVELAAPLFEVTDAIEDADKYTFTDGSWTYRTILTKSKALTVNQLTYPFKNGQPNSAAESGHLFITAENGLLPDGTSQATIDAMKSSGYTIDGNKYSYVRQYNSDEINQLYSSVTAKMQADPDLLNKDIFDVEVIDYLYLSKIIVELSALPYQQNLKGVKTNSENTKYFWSDKECNFYLKKN